MVLTHGDVAHLDGVLLKHVLDGEGGTECKRRPDPRAGIEDIILWQGGAHVDLAESRRIGISDLIDSRQGQQFRIAHAIFQEVIGEAVRQDDNARLQPAIHLSGGMAAIVAEPDRFAQTGSANHAEFFVPRRDTWTSPLISVAPCLSRE